MNETEASIVAELSNQDIESSGLASRKFILAMTAAISASVLVWIGKIDPGVYSVVMVADIGAYLTANVAQKVLYK